MMIDAAWMGRTTARNPVVIKSARRIERDATWSTLKDDAIFVAVGLLLMASFGLLTVLLWG